MVKLPLVILLWMVTTVRGYHILCVQAGLSRSHYNLMSEIANILLKAGHEVTFVTPFPAPNPPKNLHYLDVSSALKLWEGLDFTTLDIWMLNYVNTYGAHVSAWTMKSPTVQQALVNNNFDAVVSEWLFSDVEAGYAAVQHVPWIVLCGTVFHPQVQKLVDMPRDLPFSPCMMTTFFPPMNFFTRLVNTMIYLRITWKHFYAAKSMYKSIFTPISEARGGTLPPFPDAQHNASILLVNSHPSYASTHSLPPNAVEIGGYHIPDELSPLPKDLQNILDASPQGVIYFSLGSIIKGKVLQEKTRQGLLDVFRNVSQTVLWKFDEPLNNVPKNVHVRPWLPQTSILAHRNVKVFITHSGLLSTIEAVKFGVPMITVPLFFDQPEISHRMVHSGHAIEVQFSPNMAESVAEALQQILSNDSYKSRAQEVSQLFNSRPVEPKKLVLHYIELAVKTKGAAHLRLPHAHAWYEVWMLDQLAFVLLLLYVTYKLILKSINSIKNRFARLKIKHN